IDLKDLRPHVLTDDLLPEGSLKIKDPETDLNLAFKADLSKGIKADIQGSLPVLTLQRNHETVVFKGASVTGSLNLETAGATVSISAFHLDYPRLDLSGQMVTESGVNPVRMKLEARDIHVPSIREVALKLGGDIPEVQRIFAVVTGGQVPLITVTSHGRGLNDLGKVEHLLINGRMHNGRISIPATGMDLTEVNGEALISEGGLTATRLEARLGKTHGSNGSLKLGLAEDNPLFHFDMLLKTDLADALPVLKRLIHDPTLKKELGHIDDIRGYATVRLILGETLSAINARIEASEFDLNARYRPIPYLLRAKGGRLYYNNRMIKAEKIAGRIGRSSFSTLSGRLDWQEGLLELQSGTCHILLDEIYPWITSFEAGKKALQEVTNVKGELILNSSNIKGPLLTPKAWRFKTDGRLKNLTLASTRLPGPIALTQGGVKANQNTITLDDARLRILDATLNLSGSAGGYMKSVNRLEAAFDGEMGQETNRCISERIHLPEEIRLLSPVTVSQAHLVWDREAKISFSGDLSVSKGPHIFMDLLKTPGLFRVNRLTIKDDTSNAAMNFSIANQVVDFGFSGNLKGTSLESVLPKTSFLTGWIKGNLWGRIVPGNAIESTIQGRLEGGDISLRQLEVPATIDTCSLKADQQRLKFTSDIHALDNRQINVDADMDLSEQGILVKLNVAADGIDLERTMAAVKKLTQQSEGEKSEITGSPPIKGTARINLGRLKYGKFEWQPFNCDISSEENVVRIAISEAALCGISTPGTVEISPEKLSFHITPVSKGKELTPTIACLTKESIKIGGTFDFTGDIRGEGTGDAWVRSLNGPIHFVSKNGRIDRFGLLMQIFSLLNITEIFSGQLPDLRSQGFAYDSITVDGHLKEGSLYLEKALLDGSSMNIACTGRIDLLKQKLDLTVFAAPFKTADRILKMLPIIGYIMDYSVVSIAIKVTGDLKNPKVDYLPAKMLGSGILGVMKRTLEAPVRVITPMIPK
ncbi:MAG: AsmA-like C-terminal domain-containing protein, partial [Deltaproteobacteria bacterium]|nr:AsmA-like C-terminal domain-containing protein [Deltaproteobacteria bacterium]